MNVKGGEALPTLGWRVPFRVVIKIIGLAVAKVTREGREGYLAVPGHVLI